MSQEYIFKSNGKYEVIIENGSLSWERKGLKNILSHGKGGVTIPIEDISGINLKEPDMTTGYIQFIHSNSPVVGDSPLDIIKDKNTILFSKRELKKARDLKQAVENLQAENE